MLSQHHFALWAAFPEAPRATDSEKFLVTAPDSAIEQEYAAETRAARAAAAADELLVEEGLGLAGLALGDEADDVFVDDC